MPTLTLFLLNTVLEVLVTIIMLRKEIKDIKTRKEETKLSLSTDDIIPYIENSKASTKNKKTVRINEFSKVARYKINIENFVVFIYTDTKLPETEIKKTIPFKTASKRMKYLVIKLTEEVKDL